MQEKEIYELTNPQKNIYLREEYYPNTAINNIAFTYYFKKDLNLDICEKAINKILETNDALRIKINTDENGVFQYISEFNYEKISAIICGTENLNDKKQEMDKDAKIPFKFKNSKLYNFIIYKFSDHTTAIYIKLHHIIADAWVTKILLNQFMDYYQLFSNNDSSFNVLGQPSYIDFIDNEKKYFESNKFNKDKTFWNAYLKSFSEAIPFKEIAIKKNSKSFRYTRSIDFSEQINNFCKINNVTPYAFFIAIYAIYLYKTQSKKDFVIGTPILNRKNYTEKHTLGMFVSTVPVNIHIDENNNFVTFVKKISVDLISLLRHQNYPYEKILEDLRKSKNINSNLFDTILSFQNIKPDENKLNCDYEYFWNFSANQQTSFEMHITDYNGKGKYFLNLDCNESFVSQNEIPFIFNRLVNIMKYVINNDDILFNITLLDKDELLKINNTFNSITNYEPKKTLIELFEETVQAYPNNIAIKFNDIELTYSQLQEKVNIFANYLLRNNIKGNIPVSILLERCPEMVISMLATLKVGAYYITIDPFWPLDRVNYIINNSNSSILITHDKYIKDHNDVTCIDIDNIDYSSHNIIETNMSFPNLLDFAYVIYTSGSTGKPKGTMMTNKNVVNLLHSTHGNFNQSENDIWTLFHTYTFDFSAWEIYGCLLYGGKLIIVPKEITINPKEFLNLVISEKVTILNQTPAYFYKVIEEEKLLDRNIENIKFVILGGEAVYAQPLKYFKKKYPNIIIYNGYGPTETTIFAIMSEITKQDINKNNIYIGYPLPNYKIQILNKDLIPLGIGCEGEICISGNGVCSGYFNNPTMTKSKFININGELVYKSGDLGYWDIDGRIKYIGRNDNQVKIRGFRVELEEIEKELLACQYITKAIVMPVENNNYTKSLVAFIETSKENYVEEVLQVIRRNLTSYMIPKLYQIKEMPLNDNGKIDRKKLLSQITFEKKDIIAPKTELESELYSIIKKIKNLNSFSITDDFFEDLNLDSLDIMQMTTMLSKYNVEIQTINNNSSIEKLSHTMLSKDNKQLDILKNINIQNQSFQFDLTNVLLTGSTGFLGIHILCDLLKNSSVHKVYCLTRNKNGISAEIRLKKCICDYFSNEDMENLDKISIIEGDFEKINFGIEEEKYVELANTITTIIHCGANVKHYGKYNSFHKTNVIGTENIIRFANISNAKLAHISTVSVGGYSEISNIKYLNENKITIDQKFNNHVYMITKYEAECKIIEAINLGLIQAKIFRLGNIMPRLKDGKFQSNKLDNGFLSRMKTILDIKSITHEYLSLKIDLSPVDLCSSAIITILKNNTYQTIYHIFNNNILSVSDLMNHFNIQEVTNEEAINKIKFLNDPHNAHLLNDLLNPNYIETIVSNNITTNILSNLGFSWNTIDEDYLNKIFKIIKE